MYILDIKSNFKKMYIIYIIFTLFCLIFSFVYLKFSFGVVSYFMRYLFVIPLCLGVVVYFILDKIKFIQQNKLSFNLYNSAIITLTTGSGIQGILEICGATSNYIFIYLIISLIFILIAAINTIIKSFSYKNRKEV